MDTIRLFRVEKLRRAVRVVLTDGRRLDGDVFLAERTRVRAEPQEPIDMLNEDALFFPFFLNEQEMLLVAKDQVTRVEAAAPDGDPSAAVLLVIGVGCFAVFGWRQRSADHS